MNIKNKLKTFTIASLFGLSPLASNAQTSNDDTPPNAKIELTTSISEEPDFNQYTSTTENNDYNKYKPTSKDQYHLVCQNGLQALSNNNIPDELKTMYESFTKFYEENKEKEIDLNDPMVRKSFLAFKKIAKYEALNDFARITPSVAAQKHFEFEGHLPHYEEYKKGRYDEFSKLLGIDAKSFHQTSTKQDPKFIAFCSVLYDSSDRFNMLSKKDASSAEKIAERLLGEKLKAYDITPKDTTFSYSDFFQSAVFTNDADNHANNWEQHIIIDTKQLNKEDAYSPLAVVKAHELGHIMQTMPGTSENDFNATVLAELAPTIELIVMHDQIYKEIHNIPLKEEVSYPTSKENNLPNLGKIANTFRSIKEKHNLRSYEDVLLTKEAAIVINKFTYNIDEKEIMDNIRQDQIITSIILEQERSEPDTINEKSLDTHNTEHSNINITPPNQTDTKSEDKDTFNPQTLLHNTGNKQSR